ncbi:type III-B CRISPR module-associated protein Cmr5 [Psychrobacter immobilis]|uniref:type III-B CRISPR module-associated protein Cmr5 n=1 Tax=Psychrobacter immobilis TaxID=498 RepID=UPI00191A207F|nr:type III-B CRISPR module-associated protein Cmr5 [Psychrobacter immobilis]
MIRTQKYAKLAYPLVAAVQDIAIEPKYRTLALTFPAMVMQSGLSQAIGFLMAKGNEEHQLMLSHIATLLSYQGNNATDTMHQAILSSDLSKYQLLTRNTLEATSWLKRYTQALLEKEGANQPDTVNEE